MAPSPQPDTSSTPDTTYKAAYLNLKTQLEHKDEEIRVLSAKLQSLRTENDVLQKQLQREREARAQLEEALKAEKNKVAQLQLGRAASGGASAHPPTPPPLAIPGLVPVNVPESETTPLVKSVQVIPEEEEKSCCTIL